MAERFLPDVPAYLARIGAPMPQAPSAEALGALVRFHLEAVPFENLESLYTHQAPSLEPERLFEKIVLRRRGGYCFELNKLFCLLLQSLGYDCRPVAARVVHHRTDPRPLSHRATIVTVDGGRWFVDVGFGGAGPKGIASLDTDAVQTVAGEPFVILPQAGGFTVARLEQGTPEPVLAVRDEPWPDVDFEILNAYFGSSPRSPFTQKPVLYRCTGDGWVSLTGDLLTILHQGETTQKNLTPAEIPTAFARLFGLDLEMEE